jgi:hypothetical protein
MFGLSVRFRCKDEASADGFDKLVAETVPQIIAHEPGTLIYAVGSVNVDLLSLQSGKGTEG